MMFKAPMRNGKLVSHVISWDLIKVVFEFATQVGVETNRLSVGVW